MQPDFKLLTEKVRDEMIAFRRDIHEYPELSGQEVRTSRRIAEELEKLNIPYVVDEKRNVIGKLVGEKPGKRIAIRADFDALPLQENTGLPYASKVPGCMHACGHDAHAAGLLGAAKVLAPLRHQLCGTVYFCFQMGEEACQGALEIVAYLEKEGGVDMAVGIHMDSNAPVGQFCCVPGPMMAGAVNWQIKVKGVGGHGSSPWRFVDPIKPLCEIILRITSLSANRITPFEPYIVSPCVLHSGTADNIIPNEAVAAGTVRFYSAQRLEEISAVMESTAKGIAASYGAEAELVMKDPCMPVVNDAQAVELGKKVWSDLGYTVQSREPMAGSDNFGEFLNKYKGFYCFSGAAIPDRPAANGHTPEYAIDENGIIANTAFLTTFVYRFLSGDLERAE